MEFVREIRRVTDRDLVVRVPEEFRDTDVEVLILPLKDKSIPETPSNTEIETEILEALTEVKEMREGRAPKKSARQLLDEL